MTTEEIESLISELELESDRLLAEREVIREVIRGYERWLRVLRGPIVRVVEPPLNPDRPLTNPLDELCDVKIPDIPIVYVSPEQGPAPASADAFLNGIALKIAPVKIGRDLKSTEKSISQHIADVFIAHPGEKLDGPAIRDFLDAKGVAIKTTSTTGLLTSLATRKDMAGKLKRSDTLDFWVYTPTPESVAEEPEYVGPVEKHYTFDEGFGVIEPPQRVVDVNELERVAQKLWANWHLEKLKGMSHYPVFKQWLEEVGHYSAPQFVDWARKFDLPTRAFAAGLR